MEQRQDDLGDDGLPRPGTEEPREDTAEEGDAGGGPGNVSVDEPTAGALDDAGTPGGEEAAEEGNADESADDEDGDGESDDEESADESADTSE